MFRLKRKMFITKVSTKEEAQHYVDIYIKFAIMKRDKRVLKHFKPFYVYNKQYNCYLVYHFS